MRVSARFGMSSTLAQLPPVMERVRVWRPVPQLASQADQAVQAETPSFNVNEQPVRVLLQQHTREKPLGGTALHSLLRPELKQVEDLRSFAGPNGVFMFRKLVQAKSPMWSVKLPNFCTELTRLRAIVLQRSRPRQTAAQDRPGAPTNQPLFDWLAHLEPGKASYTSSSS